MSRSHCLCNIAVVTALFLFASCTSENNVAPDSAVPAPESSSGVRPVTGERIRNADAEPGNWLSNGRTYDEQRFSPLAECK